MKHKTIVTRLCYYVIQGHGINESLHELGLTPTYLERLRRSDRVKLHQAHSIYREGLQRDLANRARLGRHTGQLERALDNLPLLSLPGDDEDEEREWRRRNFADDDPFGINGTYIDAPFPEKLSQIREEDCLDYGDEEDGDDDEPDDEPEPDPKPAAEAPSAPRTSSQASVTPFAAISSRPPEDANQRRPEAEPEPKLHWYRLFTGRAQLRDEDGKVVRELMPGTSEYPSALEFENWN